MSGGKMCPFLVVALARGIDQVPVVAGGEVPPEVTCCRDNCMWYAGGKCAMQALAERLAQAAPPFVGPGRDMDTA